MTADQRRALIGTTVLITLGKLRFLATIIDAQLKFGVERILVEPEGGDGQDWKNIESVTFPPRKGGA